MAGKGIEYTLSVIDRMSAPLKNIGNSMKILDQTTGKIGNNFNALQRNASNSLNGVGRGVSALRIQLDTLTQQRDISLNWADIKQLNREIQLTENQLDKLTNTGQKRKLSLDGTPLAGIMDTLRNPVALGVGAGVAFTAGFAQSLQIAAKIDDQLGSISKSTGLKGDAMEAFKNQLKAIDTRTPLEGLLQIANIGGKMNIASNELLAYTKSVNMAAVALKDEFGGSTEAVAEQLGVLKGLFKETKSMEAGEAMSRIASAMNELSDAGKITGGNVAEFTRRMGALGQLAPNIKYTMALAGTLENLGINAEIGASGLSNILTQAGKNLPAFAKWLGVSKNEMKDMINNNPEKVLLGFANSIKNLKGDQIYTLMDALDIGTDESKKSIMALANGLGDFDEIFKKTAKGYEENTSIGKEYDIMNNTMQAGLDKMGNSFTKLGEEMGMRYKPMIMDIANLTSSMIGDGKTLVNVFEMIAVSVGAGALAWGVLNTELLLVQIRTAAATLQTWWLNSAMYANPIGAVVIGLVALGAAMIYAYNHFDGFREIVDLVWGHLKAFFGGVIDGLTAMAAAMGFLDEDKKINIEANKTLNNTVNPVGVPSMNGNVVNNGITGLLPQNLLNAGGLADNTTPKGMPKLPVADPNVLKLLGEGKDKKKDKENKDFKNDSGISGVASGGAKTVNINTTVDKIVEGGINLSTSTVSEGVDEFEKRVQEALMRLLTGINAMANQR